MLLRKYFFVVVTTLLVALAAVTHGGRAANRDVAGVDDQDGDIMDGNGGFPSDMDVLMSSESEYWKELEKRMEREENMTGDGIPQRTRPVATINVVVAGIYFFVTVVGIAANFVVFFVIIAGKEIAKTVTAMYVLQLTITDSLFLSMLPLFALHRLTNDWPFGEGMCKMTRTLQTLNYNASVFFLTAMSVDRYIAVAYNTRSQQLRTKRRTAIVCVIVWIVAFLMSLPTLLYSGVSERDDLKICTLIFPDDVELEILLEWDVIYGGDANGEYYDATPGDYYGPQYGVMNETHEATKATGIMSADYPEYATGNDGSTGDTTSSVINPTVVKNATQAEEQHLISDACSDKEMGSTERTWTIVQFITAFLIPFAIITVSYIFIVRKLRLSENKIANSVGQRTARVRKRVTRMVAILVACFVICWFPHYIMEMILLKPQGVLPYEVCSGIRLVFTALAYANSAANPLLYTFLGHNFSDRFNESIRNTRRYFLPGVLRRKIKMSSSLDCKRPSVSGKYRKSATVKTDDAREGEEIMMKNMGRRKNDPNNSSSNESPKNHKKRPTLLLLPCETEMTPVDDGKNYDDAFSAL